MGNLPFQTTDQELDEKFQQFGKIKEVSLVRDRYSNEFKGFAFITFVVPESAKQALELNGNDFQGRAMKVSMARTEERGGRFGGGVGRGRDSGGFSGNRSGGRNGGGRSSGGRSSGGGRSGSGRGGREGGSRW